MTYDLGCGLIAAWPDFCALNVRARGNQGRAIFEDDQARHRLLEALGEACGKSGWCRHAYVLINHHDHLPAEMPEANLVAGLNWLQGKARKARSKLDTMAVKYELMPTF